MVAEGSKRSGAAEGNEGIVRLASVEWLSVAGQARCAVVGVADSIDGSSRSQP